MFFQVYELCKGYNLNVQTNKNNFEIRHLIRSVEQVSGCVSVGNVFNKATQRTRLVSVLHSLGINL